MKIEWKVEKREKLEKAKETAEKHEETQEKLASENHIYYGITWITLFFYAS